jgi:hypothetical protein
MCHALSALAPLHPTVGMCPGVQCWSPGTDTAWCTLQYSGCMDCLKSKANVANIARFVCLKCKRLGQHRKVCVRLNTTFVMRLDCARGATCDRCAWLTPLLNTVLKPVGHQATRAKLLLLLQCFVSNCTRNIHIKIRQTAHANM